MMSELTRLTQEIEGCDVCPRLRAYCQQVGRQKVRRYQEETYWARPVPGFGDPLARLVIVGLAPGAHGANRTGRMFTGDDSGKWLYGVLHKFGFASQPLSTGRGDSLQLTDVYITNAVRCAPPDNKPSPTEAKTCRPFLERELALLTRAQVVLVLGKFAFDAYLKLLGPKRVKGLTFAHGAVYRFEGQPTLLCTYHPSRQNTNTGKLMAEMWESVFAEAKGLLATPSA